jgi:prevent-host-death family protein
MNVNIHQAKTHLSKLLERVTLGEEVVIAKAGRPIARIVPFRKEKRKRLIGAAKGKFTVPNDIEAPLPKRIIDSFWK